MVSKRVFSNVQEANEETNGSGSEKNSIDEMFGIVVTKQRNWRENKPTRKSIVCNRENKAKYEREDAEHTANAWHISSMYNRVRMQYIILERSFSIESILL